MNGRSTPTVETLDEAELNETGKQKIALADAMDSLAADARGADSIASDAPALSELFHKVRTSSRRSRDGRYVALLNYDAEADAWDCSSVAFLETGTHYRNPNADTSISFGPHPFIGVDQFGEVVASDLERNADAARQNAWNHRVAPSDPRRD